MREGEFKVLKNPIIIDGDEVTVKVGTTGDQFITGHVTVVVRCGKYSQFRAMKEEVWEEFVNGLTEELVYEMVVKPFKT